MESLPGHEGYETEFVETLLNDGEVTVPYFEGDSIVERMDRTRDFIAGIIVRHDLKKVDNKHTVAGGRYTPELGHHYWVRLWDPRQRV